ncbi:MAG: galactokinase [Prevotellaceae bacterium]|nr:galactokinase [Candidatus Colivivens equi]
MTCEEKFFEIYHKESECVDFCPYRVCPIGAHSDHQYGKITGLAIDKGIRIAYSIKHNGVVELCSLQFDKRAQWHIAGVPMIKENDWADYLRGATLQLSKRYPLSVGLSGVIEGSLPIGGLSSSAAVTLVFLKALCHVNNIVLTETEMISLAVSVENDYVGVSSGKLDQSCEIFSKKDYLLYLDTLDDHYELIPTNENMPPYDIAIFFSGVERSLAGSKFNMRVDECRSAAYALKAFAGMEYGKFAETFLRDVPREIFEQYKGKLPETWRLRAEHWYTEFERVEAGAEAWRKGDLEAFGRLSFESGHSSIYNYQTGSPELKTLYEIMTRTEGIYGGRFSGAGFKGCCMALINPDFVESIEREVESLYLKEFPALRGKYQFVICHSTDGIGK